MLQCTVIESGENICDQYAWSADSRVEGQLGLVEGVPEAHPEEPGLFGRGLVFVDEIETLDGRYVFPWVPLLRRVVGSVALGSDNRSVVATSILAGTALEWERVDSTISWAAAIASPRRWGRKDGVFEARPYFGTPSDALEECHRLKRKERTSLSVVVGGQP